MSVRDLPIRTRAFHLVALSGFGIAQPMFQMLDSNPVYFAVQGFHALDVVLYSIALVLVVPALGLLIELLVGVVHKRAAIFIHQASIVALTFLILFRALRSLPAVYTIIGSLAIALFAVRVYSAWEPARAFLTVCALAPILFVGLFLLRVPLAALSATEPPARTLPKVDARTDVVLLVFDEFSTSSLMTPKDAIDSRRYPNFAALARTATWYRNATTVSDATDWAVPAILTGQLTQRDQLPVVGDHPENIFTLLGRSYDMHSFQAVTRLCPPSVCPDAALPLGTRLRRVFSDVKKSSLLRLPAHQGDWDTPAEEVSDFIATLRKTNRPQLSLIHLLLPHEPLQYLPSGRTYAGGRVLDGYRWDRWTRDGRLVNQGYERYLLQVGYADRVLGQLINSLRKAGLWNRALVVVTADHGVSFRPGEHRRLVDSNNISDIAPIPLFVKRPGQTTGSVDELSARSIDVVPTVADVLDVNVPWKLDGNSLFASGRRMPSEIVVRSFTRDIVKTSWKRVATSRRQVVAQKMQLFGTGAEPRLVPGPYRWLLGKEASFFRVSRSTTIRAKVQWPSSTRFDPRSSFAPVRVVARIEDAPTASTLKLAVAVNGRIRAVTQALGGPGGARLSTFVPERSLQPGSNLFTIFAIRHNPGGEISLVEIGSKEQ